MFKYQGKYLYDGRVRDYEVQSEYRKGRAQDNQWLNSACAKLNQINGTEEWNWNYDGEYYYIKGFLFPCFDMCAAFLKTALNQKTIIRRC